MAVMSTIVLVISVVGVLWFILNMRSHGTSWWDRLTILSLSNALIFVLYCFHRVAEHIRFTFAMAIPCVSCWRVFYSWRFRRPKNCVSFCWHAGVPKMMREKSLTL